MTRTQSLSLAAAAGVLIAAAWWIGLPEGAGASGFAWFALGLGALWALAAAALWNQTGKWTLGLVVTLAIVFRLGAWAWPTDLSTDIYRYAWDGRVQLAGQSPYTAAPDAESLAPLRDDAIWPQINRKRSRTVYPPGAQLLFLSLAALGLRSIEALKAAALAADLLTLWLLAGALRRRRLPLGRLALYAWSPLVVGEVCVSGHLDAFVLPLLLLALWAAERGAAKTCGALLGFATLMKIYPLLLFAALPRDMRKRALITAALLAALLYGIYFAISGPAVLGFLPNYPRSAEDFNIGLRGLVELGFGFAGKHARTLAAVACGGALVSVVAFIARRPSADTQTGAARIALAFVLLLPTAMHPWYALWMVPFLCTRPYAAGLWLMASLPLSYLKYGPPDGPMPPWVTLVIWVPAFAFLLRDLSPWIRSRRAIR